MIRSHRLTLLAGAALVASALTASSGGVFAQTPGVPTVPTGYTELDKALGADQPYKDTKVSVQTQWIGGEGQNFANAVAGFQAATGIQVQIDSIGSSHETVLRTRIEGGAPPDVAMLAQPSAIVQYGDAGKLVDVATFMNVDQLKKDHPATIGLYSEGDKIWAIPYKVDVKSTVWYPIKAFAAKGYKVPTTWDELLALSDQIVKDGGNPWCIGMNAGTATGWQATDWLEDVVLRTSGIDVYNKWITHDVKFDSPEIKAAMADVAKIFFTPNYVLGGNTGIVAIHQTDPMDPMFNGDTLTPGCWMQKQATWYGPDFFPDVKAGGPGTVSKYKLGEDIGLFYFPPIDPKQGTPALGAGDTLMVLKDRPEVRAVAEFMATPRAPRLGSRPAAPSRPTRTRRPRGTPATTS
jgi:alpha-glucoside transport system substrate-binding protein